MNMRGVLMKVTPLGWLCAAGGLVLVILLYYCWADVPPGNVGVIVRMASCRLHDHRDSDRGSAGYRRRFFAAAQNDRA